MELSQVTEAVAALSAKVGSRADVYFSVDRRGSNISIYAHGIGGSDADIRVRCEAGDTFATLLARAEAAWDEHSGQHRRELIRKMALAIIEITASQGRCSDAALRMRFSRDDIEALGPEAVADANSIAANGPFGIATAADNGAPDEVEEDA
jgi:hypothetical protein